MIKEITSNTEFADIYETSNKPIILDFYTETCNPCKTLMPILEKLALEYKDSLVFLKTKANENIELVKQLGVAGVPTIIFVDKNKELERARGVITEKSLRTKIESLVK